MRDIIGHRQTRHDPEKPLILPTAVPPTLIERAFGRVNEWGGKLTVKKQAVAGPVLTTTLPATSPSKKRVHKLPKGVLTKASRTARRATHTAKEELRKPGKKTALVHTVALGALFAIVLSGTTPWQQSTSVAPSSESDLRRYLPSIATDPKLAPLETTTALAETGTPVKLYGWITPWNANSGTNSVYNSASAFWLTVGEDGVTMTPKASWEQWQAYKTAHSLSETYLTVSGDPDHTYKALSDLDIQSAHIANLLAVTKEQGFTGIDIDYEALGSENRDLFTAFIRNLSNVFHSQGLKVSVSLEARLANLVPMDWRAVGQIADEVRIMAYDYHGQTTGTPGPIAPLSWVAEVTAYATEHIDPNKVVIGLGNYGYDWTEPATSLDSWEGTGISFAQATTLSTEKAAPITRQTGIDDRGYDIGTVPAFTYTDTQGRLHQVWFEDAASLQEKLNAAAAYQIKGIMFWSVGDGDPALWQTRS